MVGRVAGTASYTLTIICARMWELFESVILHDPSRLRGMKELSLVIEQTLNEINRDILLALLNIEN